MTERFDAWLDALQKRHLADLRPSEVNRAVRALSDDYVHRRHRVGGDALAGRGKRAAFALFFAPLHFLTARDVARGLDVGSTGVSHVVDLGCGTGAAGAAVGAVLNNSPSVLGIDRQGWTLEEAALTYRQFGLPHRIVRGDVRRPKVRLRPGTLVIAAYTVNELDEHGRRTLLDWFGESLGPDIGLLVMEPIARGLTPWWGEWASALAPLGARQHEWRFAEPLPPRLRHMDRAAGLDHQVRTARTLWIEPGRVAKHGVCTDVLR
jgi:hypothetical protein